MRRGSGCRGGLLWSGSRESWWGEVRWEGWVFLRGGGSRGSCCEARVEKGGEGWGLISFFLILTVVVAVPGGGVDESVNAVNIL